jgi:predicted dehydrogenase
MTKTDASPQTMPLLQGAIVGCGMVSEFHLQAWNQLPEVEIVALADVDLGRASARRDALAPAARVYRSLDDLLAREKLDFVDVLTPPILHVEHCRSALQAGLHVICQKPLADSVASAKEIAAEFDRCGKLLMVHENHRYRPWFQSVLGRCRTGDLGKLVRVHLVDHHPVPTESYKLQSQLGVWFEYGVHLVDMLQALLGPPQRVSAQFSNRISHIAGESAAVVQLGYGRTSAIIDLAWVRPNECRGRMLIEGESGSIEYLGPLTRGDQGKLITDRASGQRSSEHIDPTAAYRESFVAVQRQFAECLRTGVRSTTTTDHLQALSIVMAAYQAGKRTGWCDVTLPQ